MRHALLFTIGGAIGVAALGLATTASGAARLDGPAPGRFELVTDGAVHVAGHGDAEIGPVAGDGEGGRLVLTLGGREGTAAVVATRWVDEVLTPGTYAVVAERDGGRGFTALFVPGTTDAPMGAFHAAGGTITITSVTADAIAGTFSIDAVGFLAQDPAREDRAVSVRGAFSARRLGPDDRGLSSSASRSGPTP